MTRAPSPHRGEHGSGLVEFAFIVPVAVLLFLGVFDFAMAVEEGMMVSAAAHAGAVYGISEGNFYDTSAMQTAAVTSAPGISNLTANASNFCTCTAGGTVVSCSSLCNTYDLPDQYVQVQTTASMPVLIPYPGLPVSVAFGGYSVLRAR